VVCRLGGCLCRGVSPDRPAVALQLDT
jgi:hypothetical protein